MKRRIVQVERGVGGIYLVADDGTAWWQYDEESMYYELPALPDSDTPGPQDFTSERLPLRNDGGPF